MMTTSSVQDTIIWISERKSEFLRIFELCDQLLNEKLNWESEYSSLLHRATTAEAKLGVYERHCQPQWHIGDSDVETNQSLARLPEKDSLAFTKRTAFPQATPRYTEINALGSESYSGAAAHAHSSAPIPPDYLSIDSEPSFDDEPETAVSQDDVNEASHEMQAISVSVCDQENLFAQSSSALGSLMQLFTHADSVDAPTTNNNTSTATEKKASKITSNHVNGTRVRKYQCRPLNCGASVDYSSFPPRKVLTLDCGGGTPRCRPYYIHREQRRRHVKSMFCLRCETQFLTHAAFDAHVCWTLADDVDNNVQSRRTNTAKNVAVEQQRHLLSFPNSDVMVQQEDRCKSEMPTS